MINSTGNKNIPVGTKKNHDLRVELTGDGSTTLYVPSLDEHYHSTFGAIREARHIFIGAGLSEIGKMIRQPSVLEVGMGTGLNAWLTVLAAMESRLSVSYVAVEPNPLGQEIITALNYPGMVHHPSGTELFHAIHRAGGDRWTEISEEFRLYRFNHSLEELEEGKFSFDLVYFDAFGPDVQPGIWSPENFLKIFRMMNPGGILVTYSTKGVIRRALKAAGFTVEKLPGPPGKREMLRAVRQAA